jgi:hypothetical protein
MKVLSFWQRQEQHRVAGKGRLEIAGVATAADQSASTNEYPWNRFW